MPTVIPSTGEIQLWLEPSPQPKNGQFLAWVLRHYLSAEEIAQCLIRTENGKPVLQPNPRQLHFNLSHSRDLIGCAVARGCSLGFDIERTRRSNNYRAIAQRFFSRDEYKHLCSVEGEQQQTLFYRYWTLKEALLKANGEGLAGGLTSTAFVLNDAIANCQITSNRPENWLLMQWQPIADHLCALALIQPEGVNRWQLRPMTAMAAQLGLLSANDQLEIIGPQTEVVSPRLR